MEKNFKSINNRRRHKKSRKIIKKRRNNKLSFLKKVYGMSAGFFALATAGNAIAFAQNALPISFITMVDSVLLALPDILRSADARYIYPELSNLRTESLDRLETRLTKIRTIEKLETSALTGLALTGAYSLISSDVPADKKTLVALGYLSLILLSGYRLYRTTNNYNKVETEYKRRVRSIGR